MIDIMADLNGAEFALHQMGTDESIYHLNSKWKLHVQKDIIVAYVMSMERIFRQR